MAGNEWYDTHKKNVAAALKKAKGVSKKEGVLCALVKAKDGAHLLCAGIAKNKMVMDAKKAGAKVISDGTLFNEGDETTFEVTEGEAGVRTKFAAAAAEVLGSPMTVTVVKAAAAPTPEQSGTPPTPSGTIPTPPPMPGTTAPSGNIPTPPPMPGTTPPGGKIPTPPPMPGTTPPGGKIPTPPPMPGTTPPGGKIPTPPPMPGTDEAKFTARLKALMPNLQKATADPKTGPDIKLKISEANLNARKNNYAKANELLSEAEKLAGSNIPPAPPPPGKGPAGKIPTPPPMPGTDEAKFTARLKAQMPNLQKAMADPETGKDIKLKISEANLFARKKNFAKANALLTEAENMVPGGSGSSPTPEPKEDPKAKGEPKGEDVPETEAETEENASGTGEGETEDTEEDTPDTDEDKKIKTEDIEEAEKEWEDDDNAPEVEAEEVEADEPDGLANKEIKVDQIDIVELKSAMISLKVVGKKFADKLPSDAGSEKAQIKKMLSVGSNLVSFCKDLRSKLKKGKIEDALKYAGRAHEAFAELEGLAAELDSSMKTNPYKGKKSKKFQNAMDWYAGGEKQAGLGACLDRVKAGLQIEG